MIQSLLCSRSLVEPFIFALMLKERPTFDFKAFNDEDWRSLVEKELKGKSHEDFLVWKSLDGFELAAWQSSSPSPSLVVPARTKPWYIVEPVLETDAQKANEHALNALNHGAEAIWFQKGFLGAAAEVASNDIDQEIAPVFIRNGNVIDPFAGFLKSGSSSAISHSVHVLLDGERLRERGASITLELGVLLSQFLETLRSNPKVSKVLVKTSCGSAYLSEIAKIRALRSLLSSIIAKESSTVQFEILATNLTNVYAVNDEHTNILRATSSSMSSVIGGADYVMIMPWDAHWKSANAFSARISRNIQVLLKDESHFDKNLDPAGGSYFIEHLTRSIAQSAWKIARGLEAKGGFIAASNAGYVKQIVGNSKAEVLESFRKNKRILLGVNKYNPANPLDELRPEHSDYELLPAYLHLPTELQNPSA